jgi:hypothetical protein
MLDYDAPAEVAPPICTAAYDGDLAAIQALAQEHYPNGIGGTEEEGAACFAAAGGHVEVLRFLVEVLGDSLVRDCQQARSLKANVLSWAARGRRKRETLEYLLTFPECRGGICDAKGSSVWSCAVWLDASSNAEIPRLLIDRHVEMPAVLPYTNGWTPLRLVRQ